MKQRKIIIVILLIGSLVCLAYYLGYINGSGSTGQVALLQKQASTQTQKNTAATKLNTNYGGVYSVVHIADGDTIDITVNNKKIRVRLLGINSPESVAQNRPVECYGKEAGIYMKTLVEGKSVRVELDPQKPEFDEYGRLLAYIYEGDNFVNMQMISSGNAYEYTYHNEKYKYQTEFKTAQKMAKESGLGLWADNTCGGRR